MALRLFRTFSLPMNITRSSSSNQSSTKTTSSSSAGRFLPIVLLTVGIYFGYKFVSDRSSDLRKNEHYQRATADYQKANSQGTDVKT